VVQFCQVSGGPCKLAKPDMKKLHSGVDIAMADFNALVEVLQQSMDAQGIPFGVQNRLLARLAPMHRDIVNVP
jgi:hemoglobin